MKGIIGTVVTAKDLLLLSRLLVATSTVYGWITADQLSEETEIPKRTVRRCLDKFKPAILEVKPSFGYRIVSDEMIEVVQTLLKLKSGDEVQFADTGMPLVFEGSIEYCRAKGKFFVEVRMPPQMFRRFVPLDFYQNPTNNN